MTTTTIAALATAPAPAGVAVIRVSGPMAGKILSSIFRSVENPITSPRKLVFGAIVPPGEASALDSALAVYMPAPHSYTGEDTAEFQLHGNPILAQRTLRSIYASGAVPAEPGEFTKRAFLNGKLDLVQAEAVADLISAASDNALKLAREQLEGRFSRVIDELAEPLRNCLAEIEAALDFPEEDIQPAARNSFLAALNDAAVRVNELAATYTYGHRVREGFRVWLCGLPNAGKSSLFNSLLGTERAIVTHISGTTRDLLEEEVLYSGYRFVLCDSAGIRDTEDEVEKIGVELARRRADWADLVLLVADFSDPDDRWKSLLPFLKGRGSRVWLAANKIDLAPDRRGHGDCGLEVFSGCHYVSASTGDGLSDLKSALVREVQTGLAGMPDASQIVSSERHRDCLLRAEACLHKAGQTLKDGAALEFVSADLRQALSALEEIIGRTYTEDILGRIFSRFCIGK